jgi:hypothetical protein
MKYIISESQYNRVINEGRTEFPGIDDFNGNWGTVKKLLDKFTFQGRVITNLIESSEYLIDMIMAYMREREDVDIDLRDYNLWYNNEQVREVYIDGTLTTAEWIEDDSQDDNGGFEHNYYRSHNLNELPYSILKDIYDAIVH